MTQTNDELVTSEVRKNLEELLKKMKIKNFDIDISAGSIRGDNYLGIIAKVQVNGENENETKVTLNLIVKSAPRNEFFRSLAPVRLAYDREIYIYSKVLPEFTKIQEEKGIPKPFESFAKYYNSTMENLNEALIMEDMKQIGYEIKDRHRTLDFNHALLVVKEYGKLHALSYALKDQKPKLFDELRANTQENFFAGMNNGELLKSIEQQSDRALGALDPAKHKAVYERFKTFQKSMIDLLYGAIDEKLAGQYAVITHGDCWINNLLFKYGNSEKANVPTDMCFLDWQLSRIGSPALDLSYFIFTCTDKELRDEHYDDLIQAYYASCCSFLRTLGSDPERLFPFKILQDHLKKFSVFGLYMAVMVLFVMNSEVDEIPDIHDLKETDNLMDKFKYETKNIEKYNTRIRGVILDFDRLNYDF